MTQYPAEFEGVHCLVGAQPLQTAVVVRHQLALAGVAEDRLDRAMDDLDQRIRVTTSLGFVARDSQAWARNVMVPTLLHGVHEDVLTDHADLETVIENIPVADDELCWIHDTVRPWTSRANNDVLSLSA